MVSIVVVAAIVALLGGGVAAAGVTASQSLSPSHNVEAFLQAMVDGRVQDAVAASGGEPTGVSLALLNDNVYRAADNRITDYRITGTTVNGDNATVSTVITQGTTQLDQTFSLSKSGTVLGLVDS